MPKSGREKYFQISCADALPDVRARRINPESNRKIFFIAILGISEHHHTRVRLVGREYRNYRDEIPMTKVIFWINLHNGSPKNKRSGGYFYNAINPACSKCLSPVRASLIPSRA